MTKNLVKTWAEDRSRPQEDMVQEAARGSSGPEAHSRCVWEGSYQQDRKRRARPGKDEEKPGLLWECDAAHLLGRTAWRFLRRLNANRQRSRRFHLRVHPSETEMFAHAHRLQDLGSRIQNGETCKLSRCLPTKDGKQGAVGHKWNAVCSLDRMKYRHTPQHE